MFFGYCHLTRFRDSFCLASVFEMTVYLLTYLLTYFKDMSNQTQFVLLLSPVRYVFGYVNSKRLYTRLKNRGVQLLLNT